MFTKQYPIGRFEYKDDFEENKEIWLTDIEKLAFRLSERVVGLSDEQLDTPYREGGWTIRQVVHHLVDSHINSYIRFRWALTEDNPTIKAYNEADWAELPDAKSAPVALSLALLLALHARWVWLLNQLTPSDWKKTLVHPESGDVIGLEQMLALYAWHSRHHLAHIENLIKEKNW